MPSTIISLHLLSSSKASQTDKHHNNIWDKLGLQQASKHAIQQSKMHRQIEDCFDNLIPLHFLFDITQNEIELCISLFKCLFPIFASAPSPVIIPLFPFAWGWGAIPNHFLWWIFIHLFLECLDLRHGVLFLHPNLISL